MISKNVLFFIYAHTLKYNIPEYKALVSAHKILNLKSFLWKLKLSFAINKNFCIIGESVLEIKEIKQNLQVFNLDLIYYAFFNKPINMKSIYFILKSLKYRIQSLVGINFDGNLCQEKLFTSPIFYDQDKIRSLFNEQIIKTLLRVVI